MEEVKEQPKGGEKTYRWEFGPRERFRVEAIREDGERVFLPVEVPEGHRVVIAGTKIRRAKVIFPKKEKSLTLDENRY